MNYYEKLKDPRWQRKRLEILARDFFTCLHCGDTDKQLHVHHLSYLGINNPWEALNEYLITICDDCHRIEETKVREVKEMIANLCATCQTINPVYDVLKNTY